MTIAGNMFFKEGQQVHFKPYLSFRFTHWLHASFSHPIEICAVGSEGLRSSFCVCVLMNNIVSMKEVSNVHLANE